MNPAQPAIPSWPERWQRFASGTMRAFHRYATWLVSISWRRFVVLSLLLIILATILQSLPPFSWRVRETIEHSNVEPRTPAPPKAPKPPKAAEPAESKSPPEPVIRIEKPRPGASNPSGIDISIDERGIRITPKVPAPSTAASGPAAAASSGSISIALPSNASKEEIREAVRGAVEEARDAIREVVQAQREAIDAAREARLEAEAAMRAAQADADAAVKEAQQTVQGRAGPTHRTRVVHWGDFLPDLAIFWVLGSALIKITYKGRMLAEVKAAEATETAEAESLKRQVVEARMAAMQAQVEPHFLFNTLASIDHLIETDPPRASQMQKHLIALLRASMPTMREAAGGGNGKGNGARDLNRELAMVRPYLEILKVRMEERLTTQIDVPDGLLSAEFPQMMIQTLVENAIKHGLEPKPEGGQLIVKAEIVHGKLAVTVADTGLGFGRAATAGTGVGLANIRERLQMLYGPRASLTVAENQPSGTRVTITVPYKAVEGAEA
jgi:signal transduction histidine kinase